MTRSEARAFISAFVALRESATDEQAVLVPNVFPAWKPEKEYKTGDRIQYQGKLYKVITSHTSQEDWIPDKTSALYIVIDVSHAGTQDDPIPAERGMEYVYGLYYRDGEDGKLYLCQRTGEAASGTVVLQYLPHELVGHYFVEVT